MKSIFRSRSCPLWLIISGFSLLGSSFFYPAFSHQAIPKPSRFPPSRIAGRGLRDVAWCQKDENIETLTTLLLRDLPGYANRGSQRARRLSRQVDVYSYMVVAGRPEFAPLPLNAGVSSVDVSKTDADGVKQVFFTTLERQYTARKAVQLQQFHWLFLTKSESGWRKVMMFTQTGYYPVNKQPPSPPRDSSNGVIAQAVDTWLQDCRGAIR
jgi:hypothetical protein